MAILTYDLERSDDSHGPSSDDRGSLLRLSQDRPTLVAMTIAERVRELIGRRGQTQAAFAAEIGLDPTKLSKSLSGVRRFSSPRSGPDFPGL